MMEDLSIYDSGLLFPPSGVMEEGRKEGRKVY
jgi:hypothetical protein